MKSTPKLMKQYIVYSETNFETSYSTHLHYISSREEKFNKILGPIFKHRLLPRKHENESNKRSSFPIPLCFLYKNIKGIFKSQLRFTKLYKKCLGLELIYLNIKALSVREHHVEKLIESKEKKETSIDY